MSAKVTLQHSTPSEKIIAKQKSQIQDNVIDASGRVIKLRMPDALDEFDLNSALGDDSTNLGCAGMAHSLLYVESINGEPFTQPRSNAQIRAGIRILGRDGMKAVAEALQAYAEETKIANEQEQSKAIKK